MAPNTPSTNHSSAGDPPEGDVTLGPTAAPASTQHTPGPTRARDPGLSNWVVARYTLVVVAVVGGLYLLWRIQEVLVLLLLAILLATAIEPLVNRLRRGPFSRGQGILIVYSAIFGALTVIATLFVPPLVTQTAEFIEDVPDRLAALRPQIEQVGPRPLRDALLRAVGGEEPTVQRALEPVAPDEPAELVEAGGVFLETLFSVVTIFLLTYYWLTERALIKRALLRLAPTSRARDINTAWMAIEARLGGWVRGQLMVMGSIALATGVVYWLLGLPNPILLAVLAGVFEIVPMIGPFLAFVPALIVALSVDPWKALLLIPIAVVIQQIEANVLVPRIMSHSVGVSPLTVILGILIGAATFGAAGAFLAVPVAAAIQVVLSSLLHPVAEDEGPRPGSPTPADKPTGIAEPPVTQASILQ